MLMPTMTDHADDNEQEWTPDRIAALNKRNQALRQKAVESIYFDTPEKALAIVKQCEKMLKGCEK